MNKKQFLEAVARTGQKIIPGPVLEAGQAEFIKAMTQGKTEKEAARMAIKVMGKSAACEAKQAGKKLMDRFRQS